MVGVELPRLDNVGAVNGPTDLLESQYVVCSFSETLAAVRSGKLRSHTPNEYARIWFPGPTDLVDSFIAADSPVDTSKYSILVALLHRIWVAYSEYHRLMDVRRRMATDAQGHADTQARRRAAIAKMAALGTSPEDNFRRYAEHIRRKVDDSNSESYLYQTICYMWKQYISCHFKMAHHFWQRPVSPKEWTDDILLIRPENNVASVYESTIPDMRQPISVGMLPDLSAMISRLGWFRDNVQDRQNPMAHLWVKVMNRICAVRNWQEIMMSYIDNKDGILEVITLCTLVSTLRLYPYAEGFMGMHESLEIWDQLTVQVQDIDVHRSWISQHVTLLWFSLREYLFFLLQRNDPLLYVMTRFNNTAAVIESVGRGLDHVAAVYMRYGTFVDQRKDVDAMEMLSVQYHRNEQLRYPMRVHKRDFLHTLASELRSAFERRFVHNPVYSESHPVLQETVDEMRHYVARLDPSPSLIFRRVHFEHWGLSPVLLDQIFACKLSHEISNDADHSTSSQLARILNIHAREFHLLLVLALTMVEHCSFEPVPLPATVAESQERALRSYLDMEPWKVPTDEDITDHLCPSCVRVCSTVSTPCWQAQTATQDTESSSPFDNPSLLNRERDSPNVRYDSVRNCLICRRPQQVKQGTFQEILGDSSNAGDLSILYRAGDRVAPKGTSRGHESSRIMRALTGRECIDTPLVPIWWIGTAWRLNGVLYAACCTCYNIVEMSTSKFGPNGITCTGHIDDNTAIYRPNANLYPRMGPVPSCSDAKQMPGNLFLVRNGYDWPAILSAKETPGILLSSTMASAALWTLIRSRAVPMGVDRDTFSGATLSSSTRNRIGKLRITLEAGVLTTNARVLINKSLVDMKKRPELTSDMTKSLRFSTTCYFCNSKRHKPNRPDDRAWVVFCAIDSAGLPMVVFLCSSCKGRIPQPRQGILPTYNFEQLKGFKDSTPNYMAQNRRKYAKK